MSLFPELLKFLNLLESRDSIYLKKVYWRWKSLSWRGRDAVNSTGLYEIIKNDHCFISLINIDYKEESFIIDGVRNFAILLDICSNSLGCMSCIITIEEFEKFLKITTDKVNWKKEGF